MPRFRRKSSVMRSHSDPVASASTKQRLTCTTCRAVEHSARTPLVMAARHLRDYEAAKKLLRIPQPPWAAGFVPFPIIPRPKDRTTQKLIQDQVNLHASEIPVTFHCTGCMTLKIIPGSIRVLEELTAGDTFEEGEVDSWHLQMDKFIRFLLGHFPSEELIRAARKVPRKIRTLSDLQALSAPELAFLSLHRIALKCPGSEFFDSSPGLTELLFRILSKLNNSETQKFESLYSDAQINSLRIRIRKLRGRKRSSRPSVKGKRRPAKDALRQLCILSYTTLTDVSPEEDPLNRRVCGDLGAYYIRFVIPPSRAKRISQKELGDMVAKLIRRKPRGAKGRRKPVQP